MAAACAAGAALRAAGACAGAACQQEPGVEERFILMTGATQLHSLIGGRSAKPESAPSAPFIHSHALVESDSIGPGTRIWAFAHVMAGAVIGAGCNICDHTYIDRDVIIGDRVTIKAGVYVIDGMRVADDVFIGPLASFTNDRFPRSRQPFRCERIVIERGASIGAGAIFLPGVTVGTGAMVGAGSVVTRDVPPFTVVAGNPARVLREVSDDELVPGLRRP